MAIIIGTPLNNYLEGTSDDDTLQGLAGDDTLLGLGGDDLLDGGDGNDSLNGGSGSDLLQGGEGNDDLEGESGAALPMQRASTDDGGVPANGTSEDPSISGDGRYVAFESGAINLVPGDTNAKYDVFVKDLVTGDTVSLTNYGNGISQSASISEDGKYVAFESRATNLVSGDTNGRIDIFRASASGGAVVRVSVAEGGEQADGSSTNPSISADGRYVAFQSAAKNLAPEAASSTASQIFVKDMQTGEVRLASMTQGGALGNGHSVNAAISADGLFVAFESDAENLVGGVAGFTDIFVKNLVSGQLTKVTFDANADNYNPSIAVGGGMLYVAFTGYGSNLVAGDANGQIDVFVWVMNLGTGATDTVLVSTAEGGTQGDGTSYGTSISVDGNFVRVAFSSAADNLVSGDTNAKTDIFVKTLHVDDLWSQDLATGTIDRISMVDGIQGNDHSTAPSISADGTRVAFESDATNLVAPDTNHVQDIFVAALPGAAAVDTLVGGPGQDIYLIHSPTDVIVEVDGEGVDLVYTDLGAYTLPETIELLRYIGAGTFHGVGNVNANHIWGGPGNDLLEGLNDTDTLYGGDGRDTLLGGEGDYDWLYGEDGNDVLDGGPGIDTLDGGEGDDRLAGGAGSDYLFGGPGIDTADFSGEGFGIDADLATGFATPREGGGAADVMVSIENLVGSAYDDTLFGHDDATANFIDGGDGNDTLSGLGGNDTLEGGLGDDYVHGGTGDDHITDMFGANTLLGSLGNDFIYGGFDADTIDGGEGDDWLGGYGGYDIVHGGDGNDTLMAEDADLLFGDAGNDLVNGSGQGDEIWGGDGHDFLNGYGGNDTIYGEADDDLINGGAGEDDLSGGPGDDTLFGDLDHDLLRGGTGDDFLAGGADNDGLHGGEGDDTLRGDDGDDALDGSYGSDTADYADAATGIIADLGAGTATGQGNDIFYSIENLKGSAYDDNFDGDGQDNRLEGRDGNDTLDSGDGDDTLVGGAGNDRLVGGPGSDWSIYSAAPGSIVASLTTGTAIGDGDDTLISIENLVGGHFDDSLTGNGDANRLEGGGGNDSIYGLAGADTLVGGGGDDTLDGGEGSDTADYSENGVDIEANLANGTVAGASTDHLISIENLVGTRFADELLGDGAANRLQGGAGDDTLRGFDGDDTLAGGADDDFLAGGDGVNTAEFSGATGPVTASLATGYASGEGFDTLVGFQRLIGSAHGDELTGDDGDNTLEGGAGDDTLIGGGGDDSLDGGDGSDTADYSENAVSIEASLEDGTVEGASTDYVSSIENLVGTDFADVMTGDGVANRLRGGAGDDTLRGLGGNDFLSGGAGDDLIDGGDGIDTAVYDDADVAVNVDLFKGTGLGSSVDTLIGIENVVAGDLDDVVTGDDNANHLDGRAGNDTLIGNGGDDTLAGGSGNDDLQAGAGDDSLSGGAGDDTIVGGPGLDTVDFASAAEAVSASLVTGLATGDGDDVLDGIENLVGGDHDDDLAGDSGSNALFGGAGIDTLGGDAGDDTLGGDGGDDTIDGGAGTDTAVWSHGAANYSLSFAGAEFVVEDTSGTDGTDTLAGIERLQFADKTVIVETGTPTQTYAGLPAGLYHFFIVAFDAAPGVTYLDQLAEAWWHFEPRLGEGALQEIVEIFTTKHQFTDVYPLSLSDEDLAIELVNRIVKASASDEAKEEAIADVQAALGIGWTRGEVIYTVFGNLAAKPYEDPTWGGTAQQFANQIEVAKYYSEVLNQSTTDLETLRDVLQPVVPDTDVSTPEAIATLIGVALMEG